VIPLDYITEWRAEAPWTMTSQVEQDLMLSRALVEMFTDSNIGDRLAFRGGTALYKLHIRPAARYSENIDLVQVDAGPIGGVIDDIRRVLDPWLGTPKRTAHEGRVVLVYRTEAEGLPAAPMRLKIEINSREHFSVFGYDQRRFETQSRWFTGAADVTTFQLDELLGTKLRALYQRKKGRDLYDLFTASRRMAVDLARVVTCFHRYLEHDGLRVSRAEFEMNLHEKLTDRTFLGDVTPLITRASDWDVDAAAAFAMHEIAPLFIGEPWRGVGPSDERRRRRETRQSGPAGPHR
jgi:predicted nucleotidyltransferase component of viral defense system